MNHTEQTRTSSERDWPAAGGETGALIRTKDWSKTSLGPRSDWPQSLRSALDICLNSNLPITICWGSDLILFYNDVWKKLLGDAYAPAIGISASEVFKDNWQTIGPMFEQVLSTGKTAESRNQLLSSSADSLFGDYFDFLLNPILKADGAVGGVFNIATQTARHVPVDKAISNSDRQFCKMIDALPSAVYVTDNEGRLTHFNPAAVQFSGRVPELGSDRWCVSWKLYHPDGRPMPREECPMAVALREGRSLTGAEAIAERPDGKRVHFEAYPSPLYNEEGEITGGINMLVDITERRQAESRLRRSERELADFFENATLGLRWVGPDGTILKVNQAELDMLGYSHDEYVGRSISDFHVDQDVIDDILRRLKAGEELQEYEACLRCKDGSIRHVLISSSVYREHGEFVHTRCFTRDVTEKKHVEIALAKTTANIKQQKRLYEAIISSTPDLVYVFDLNYRFTFVNDALLQMWGRTLEESIGKNLLEVGYEPWHTEMHEREINQVITTKQPVRGEVPFPHAKLGERIYDYIFVPVLNEEGEVEAVAGTTRDVTRRKKVEAALRESEEKYRTLFETIDAGFCIIKVLFDENEKPVDYRFLEVNSAFEKHTGLEDAQGKRIRELTPDIEQHWPETYGQVALTGEPVRFEDSSEAFNRWFDVYAFRVGEPQEQKVALLFNDITERRRVQQERDRLLMEVETERERLADIFQRAPSFMCVLRGPDHVFERVNDLYFQLVGNRELIGKPVREAIPEAEGQGFFELLDQVYQTGEAFTGTEMKVELQRHSGGDSHTEVRYIDFVYQPLRDADGTVIGIFVQGVDLTERRHAKDELKKINETLEERVEKRTEALLSYQDQLRSLAFELSRAEEHERQRLATELHDNLGQMLAVGKMKLDMLLRAPLPDKAASGAAEIAELVDDAIRYTRALMSELKPPSSLDKENLTAGIRWVAEKMKKHNLEVSVEDDERPKPLEEEVSSTLLQCTRELLFNVVKHAGVDEARVVLKRQGDQVSITVEDEGKGFSLDGNKPAPTESGGFGLFNVQERIDLMGGNLKVNSRPGEGTQITLLIPVAGKHKADVDGLREQTTARGANTSATSFHKNNSGHKIKVLLVDDHRMMRKGLRKMIEEEDDMTVIAEAPDGKEAVKLAGELKPDIIVMDVNMPVMSGIEATRQITTNNLAVRVIGLSLQEERRVARAMRMAGASAYLTKADVFETLCATIRSEAKAVDSSNGQ